VYEVPGDVGKDAAELALAFGCAVIVREVDKKAPENKVTAPPETKAPAKKKAKSKK
jgi:hypothetical protein